MATISMSLGKNGIGPHVWPMQNPKASCYGLKLWILTLEHDIGFENHPWCTKNLNVTPHVTRMPDISYE